MTEALPTEDIQGRSSGAEYGSDYIIENMRELGIEHAAFNPGASFRGIHDSIVNFEGSNITVVECCHEEIAVAIAHGYAKAVGKPMAAILHDVVGLQHATMAIFNAWVDRVPVYLLGGTGPMDASRRRPWIEWIHTANIQGSLVRDYTKFDDQPAGIRAVPQSMLRAWRTMMAEPQGPVYVNFDVDIQEEPTPKGLIIPDSEKLTRTTRVAPDPEALGQVARWLLEAQSPVIITQWLGRNPETVSALVKLAELVGCPVVSGEQRLSFPTTHGLNMSGGERQVLGEADFILALDVWDLQRTMYQLNPATQELASIQRPGSRLAVIGLSDLIVRSWAHDFQALYPANLSLVADTALAVPMLTEELRRRMNSGHRDAARRRFEAVATRRGDMRERLRRQAASEGGEPPVSVGYLTGQVWERIKSRDWVLAYHSWPDPRKRLQVV